MRTANESAMLEAALEDGLGDIIYHRLNDDSWWVEVGCGEIFGPYSLGTAVDMARHYNNDKG